MSRTLALTLALTLSACTTINQHTPPPADWPPLRVTENKVPMTRVLAKCYPSLSLLHKIIGSIPMACAWVLFDLGVCEIYIPSWAPLALIEHERLHCQGHDHVGASTLRDAWDEYKRTGMAR